MIKERNMLIIPAIDLLDGKAVRLYQGDYAQVSTYENDPIVAAKRLEQAGVSRIHVVDLDAARQVAGQPGKNNRRIISAIKTAISCEIEVGGGIRSRQDVVELQEAGVDWLIVGTAIVKEPDAVAAWLAEFPGKFIAGIDARDGKVKIAGWEGDAGLDDIALSQKAKSMGFSAIIYTNISRDGTLSGPDIARTNAVALASGLPVVISGGIGNMADIQQAVEQSHPGVFGIITGKALYEGHLDLVELCRRLPQAKRY